MNSLDSLLSSYKSKPAYYIRFGNHGCLYDLQVNDVYTDKLTSPSRIGSTLEPINSEILKCGKNKISLKLYPFPGVEKITERKPFHLEVIYKDFALSASEQTWNTVLEMPAIEVPEEGLPYYKYEAEFEAVVPYENKGWSNCIDLRQIPNIEERVVEEFKRIRQLMVDRKSDELKKIFSYKNNELAIALYQSSEFRNKEWEEHVANIEEASPIEWQLIEDYELFFYADGRLVTLESKKERGFPSALVWIKEEENDEYEFCYFDLRLGILEGTDKLIPIR